MTRDRLSRIPQESPQDRNVRIGRYLLLGAILVVVTIAAYVPALRAGFIWDDDVMVTDNLHIRQPDGLRRIWLSREPTDYFPLTYTSFWFEWRLWGMNAAGYHATNVLLHVADVILLWLVLRRLKVPGAWLASLIFAVHPVNVASAAWITERKNTLSLFFFLLTILFYMRFSDGRRWRWHVIALVAFALALSSKTSVVILPFVLLGCLWWMRRRIVARDALDVVPFFALSLLFGLLTVWFQHQQAMAVERFEVGGFVSRVAAAGWAVWFYLYKAVVPVHLSMVYPRWEIGGPSGVGLPLAFIPDALLIVAFIVLWRYRRTWGRPCLFAFGYCVVALAPTLGFVKMFFLRYSQVADHWQHLSIIGAIALGVGVVTHAASSWGVRMRRAAIASCVLVVCYLCLLTWKQCGTYRNEETLWRHAFLQNPTGGVVQERVGVTLMQRKRMRAAMVHLKAALKWDSTYAPWHYNIACALFEQKEYDGAIAEYREALRIRPGFGLAAKGLADSLAAQGKYEDAVTQYQRALELGLSNADVHYNLGQIFTKWGRYADAVREYESALRINSDDMDTWDRLGSALLALGDRTRAEAALKEAWRRRPK